MQTRMLSWMGSTFAGMIGLCGVAQAGVHYVDATGNGDYRQIQAAIDASLDGDVILVRSGTYAGFIIDQRRMFIMEDASANAKIAGTVTIRNTTGTGVVLLAGLEINANVGVGATALVISSCAGNVRVQDCVLRGGEGQPGFPTGGAGGRGVDIQNSARVSLDSVDLRGGAGFGFPVFGPNGGPGGSGLETFGSSVALYDCTLRGGAGGDADYAVPTFAGRGGDGVKVITFGILASGCAFIGGTGGGESLTPGAGGDGLNVASGAQAQLVDNTYAGGNGGFGYNGSAGATGQPQTGGGLFHALGGVRRKFHARVLAPENSMLTVDVSGEAGDKVWLFNSPNAAYVYSPSLAGVTLVQLPLFTNTRALGILPASGSATFSVPIPSINGVVDAQRNFLQGVVLRADGVALLGSPMHLVTLNCSALSPDCNSNGDCDSCDLLRGTSNDCDANGVPDECQSDCNGNGVADVCDITAGTSVDLNHNAIPDECEAQHTWYVDDSASAGGNGSAGSPFQSLGQPFGLAISGDTILVADGLYVGAQNRNLVFGGRSLVVQSLGGLANCTIDLQLQGRAFQLDAGAGSASRIEGFTIKNGKAPSSYTSGGAILMEHSNATIANCWFSNNQAAYAGGAIVVNYNQPSIRACVFDGNHAGQDGGAINSSYYSGSGIADCTFANNTAIRGGALYFYSVGTLANPTHIERCAFLGNSVTNRGGALHCISSTVQFDQCLIAGNAALQGGAIWDYASNLRVINCTLVDNQASSLGGAMYTDVGSGAQVARILRNSIFWNNNSSNGKQFDARFGLLDIDSCSVQNGAASIVLAGTATAIYGTHNQTVRPQFVDQDGPDNNAATIGDNNYRLALNSPCIDAGQNSEVEQDNFDLDGDGNYGELVPLDFDGLPRLVDIPTVPDTGLGSPPLVDFGPWERQP